MSTRGRSLSLLRATRAGPLLLVVLAAAALAAVLDARPELAARTLVWLAAGVALGLRARRRPEPTGAMLVLAGGNLLVGAGWALALAGSPPAPVPVAGAELAALTVGTAGIGIATLLATPTWRHRAELLDGLVVAVAGSAVVLLVVSGGAQPDNAVPLATVYAAVFAAFVGPCVLVASLLTRNLRPAPGSLAPTLGLLGVLYAGTATAVAAMHLEPLPAAAAVVWLAVPGTGLVMAAWPDPTYRTPRPDPSRRPSWARLTLLGGIALLPAVVGAIAGSGWQGPALLVSLCAALVLAARVAVSSRLELAQARAVADVRFEALVEHAAEVLALADAEDRLFYVSGAVHETFRVERDRVLGRSPVELAHPEDREAVEDLMGRVREQPGVPLQARVRLLDGEGGVRHVDVTLVDLLDVDGVGAVSLTVRDVTDRVELEAELVRQARTDGLTGLVTRNVIIERVDHVLTARHSSAALLFIDLDDFKLINDGFGHAAGDEVLAVIAGRLQVALREHDTAGRMGGDEFAVLLEELSDDPVADALQVAQRIVERCAAPVVVADEPVQVRLSVGVALPEDDATAAELFAAADAAMYEAKRNNRDVVLYESGMRGSSRSRLRLMRDVREAIDEGHLEVSYQPIVDTRTRELRGVEALLRWVHPTMGSVTPDVILDHADAAGVTADLTRRIIATIGDDLRTWRSTHDQPLAVAINLSAQQLTHVEPDQVLRELTDGTDSHGLLTIEVTETSMLGDISAAARVLDRFRESGCHVAIDDFGTGYASIGYLRRLPLDRLKIDREFVDGLDLDVVDRSFAAVIQGLAAALDLVTVAEGVETEQQLEAVRRLGCDMAQGFLFSRGLPMPELVTWATDHAGGSAATRRSAVSERE